MGSSAPSSGCPDETSNARAWRTNGIDGEVEVDVMMDRPLLGMAALVTGASGALGRAIAVHLASSGARVACHFGTRPAGAEKTLSEIKVAGGEGIVIGADVCNRAAVDAMVATTIEEFGRIDILVNNAGTTRDGLIARMSDDDWDDVIATNLRSAFLTTRAVMRAMLRQRSGRIINVTSVMGIVGNAGQANYAAAKAGMIGLTRSTAREVASRGITCNAIAPGFIDAGLATAMTDEQKARAIAAVPMGITGTPDDVGAVAAFLCTAGARYVTGQVLNVDGGMVMA
jgi:3-oxoacyl-[acyl-carrier protein] reductase